MFTRFYVYTTILSTMQPVTGLQALLLFNKLDLTFDNRSDDH